MNLNKFKLFYDLLANSISARDIAHSTKSFLQIHLLKIQLFAKLQVVVEYSVSNLKCFSLAEMKPH